jgi:hypothetical protein
MDYILSFLIIDRPLQQYLEVIHTELEAFDVKKAAATPRSLGDSEQIGDILLVKATPLFTTPREGLRTESATSMIAVLITLVLSVLAVQLS